MDTFGAEFPWIGLSSLDKPAIVRSTDYQWVLLMEAPAASHERNSHLREGVDDAWMVLLPWHYPGRRVG